MRKEPYYRFSTYLKSRFGSRVSKIMLDLGLGCPNRDGTLSYYGCIYCDELGSGTGFGKKLLLEEQIEKQLEKGRKKGIEKFIGYFQSYSNTYCLPEFLSEQLNKLLKFPEIVLVYIGTRPDIFTGGHLDVLLEFKKIKEIGIEFGLQSSRDKTLEIINRHHTFKDFETAVNLTKGAGIFTTAHVIIGLPFETVSDNISTAAEISRLGIDSVKIHQLYIIRGTRLELMYREKKFAPLTFKEAIDRTIIFLRHLNPNIIIQRITGDPKPGQYFKPDWIKEKSKFLRELERKMLSNNFLQGDLLEIGNEGENEI